MAPLAVLAIIVLLPLVFLTALRINAVLVFLSLCLGDVLIQFVAGDTNSLLSFIASSNAQHISAGSNASKIALLLFPPLLTMLFIIKSVHGSAKLIINLLPAAGVGLLLALLLVPLLPAGLGHNITALAQWDQLRRAQDLIVGASSLVCLMVLWQQRPHKSEGKHGKH